MANKPLSLYESVRITHGPLTGMTGIIHEIKDEGKILVVLVQGKNRELFPPLPFSGPQLTPYYHMAMRLLGAVVHLILLSMLALYIETKLIGWLCVILVAYSGLGLYLLRLKVLSKRSKACPICGEMLDSDTSYSTCPACGWVRPMPELGAQHLKEFLRTG